jgi:hypothetical protein
MIMGEMTKPVRRLSVFLNYLCVALLILFIDARHVLGWGTVPVAIAACGAFVLGLITFIRVFWRTGLWKVTHAGFRHLDERQVQVAYAALRNSYWIFAIVCLAILYVNSVIEKGHIPVLVAAAVLYLAHTLPAAVMAWTEREVLTSS